jgi:hypothetical protein
VFKGSEDVFKGSEDVFKGSEEQLSYSPLLAVSYEFPNICLFVSVAAATNLEKALSKYR